MQFRPRNGRFRLEEHGPETTLFVLTVALLVAGLVLARFVPLYAVLPALSLLIIAAAFVVAAAAWVLAARPKAEAITYWDLAGGLMLIGISAALLADSDAIAALA